MRILHFSDVHVQRPVTEMPLRDWVTKRALASANLFFVRWRLFEETPQKLAALEHFARNEGIDLAICTGDYTALGTETEHAAAAELIAPIVQAAPLGYCTVPGNHDLYLNDSVREERFSRYFGHLFSSDLRDYAVDGPYPYVRLFGDDLAVVGVNSARPNPNPFLSAGMIPEAQLLALAQLLDDPRLQRRRIFVVTHYGILRADGTPDAPRHGLENAGDFVEICNRETVAILHGHIHHRYMHPPAEGRPWIFCSGSATHRGREGMWIYDVQAGRMRATPVGYVDGTYQAFALEAVELPVLGACRSFGQEDIGP